MKTKRMTTADPELIKELEDGMNEKFGMKTKECDKCKGGDNG